MISLVVNERTYVWIRKPNVHDVEKKYLSPCGVELFFAELVLCNAKGFPIAKWFDLIT